MRKFQLFFLGAGRPGYSAHRKFNVHILMWICDKISKDFLEVSAESYCARNTFPEVTQGVCCMRKQSLFLGMEEDMQIE